MTSRLSSRLVAAIRRVGHSQDARGSAVIAASMSAAGFGYFVFGLLPGTSYSAQQLSTLSVWQAFSFGAGLAIAGPLNGVVYYDLLRARGKIDDEGFARVAKGVLLVGATTSEVYGTARYVPIDEGHPLQAQSPYSATKMGADHLVNAYVNSFSLPGLTIRPFNTYGPRQSARSPSRG